MLPASADEDEDENEWLQNREKLKQLAGWIDPYRVTDGAKFRLKKIDPSDTRGLKADKSEAAEAAVDRCAMAGRRAGQAVRAGPALAVTDFSGDGRGRQGQHDQARDERRESAGRAGRCIQAAVTRRTRSRLDVALLPAPSRARPHRYFQSLVLRRSARGTSAPGDPARAEAAAGVRRQRHFRSTAARHRGDRRLSGPQRHVRC